jgi:CxxC motif-containing protein (DUF1111 family)
VSCGDGGQSVEERTASGGEATINDSSSNAFSFPIPSLSTDERRDFFVGNSFFNDNWVTAPASTDGRDGLGPLFNAQSCSSCHFRDGRGQPPASDDDPVRGLLIRLSVPGQGSDRIPLPDPNYGDQIQDRSILGIEPEGSIAIEYHDFEVVTRNESVTLALPDYAIAQLAYGPLNPDLMMSPRIAPQIPGVGLLEVVPEEDILALADPVDSDGDSVSGRPNMVWDSWPTRSGWAGSAGRPTFRHSFSRTRRPSWATSASPPHSFRKLIAVPLKPGASRLRTAGAPRWTT